MIFLLAFIAAFIDRGLFPATRGRASTRAEKRAEKQVIAVRGRIELDQRRTCQ